MIKRYFFDGVSLFLILHSSSVNDLTLSPKNVTDYLT